MAYLIALEGIDGSGKGTQTARLRDRLTRAGRRVEVLSFPRYEATFFGRAVGEFLNGAFGSLDEVHPFLVALLFAGDRFESLPVLRSALATAEVVLLDRYVYSNVAHQASKRAGAERELLTQRILHLEHELYQLPRPDQVLLLDLPVPWAQQLIARKAGRSYTDKPADLQEADANYLGEVRAVYRTLAAHEPGWHTVSVTRDDQLRSPEEITHDLWQALPSSLTALR